MRMIEAVDHAAEVAGDRRRACCRSTSENDDEQRASGSEMRAP